jgi:hypothetical protein
MPGSPRIDGTHREQHPAHLQQSDGSQGNTVELQWLSFLLIDGLLRMFCVDVDQTHYVKKYSDALPGIKCTLY